MAFKNWKRAKATTLAKKAAKFLSMDIGYFAVDDDGEMQLIDCAGNVLMITTPDISKELHPHLPNALHMPYLGTIWRDSGMLSLHGMSEAKEISKTL